MGAKPWRGVWIGRRTTSDDVFHQRIASAGIAPKHQNPPTVITILEGDGSGAWNVQSGLHSVEHSCDAVNVSTPAFRGPRSWRMRQTRRALSRLLDRGWEA